MKTKNILLGMIAAVLLSFTACNDFNVLNDGTINRPDDNMFDFDRATLGMTIRRGIDLNFNRGGGQVGAAHLHERIKNLTVDFYSHYLNPSGNWSTRNYIPNNGWNEDYWEAHYQWLGDLNLIILAGSDMNGQEIESRINNVQIARIMRVFIQSQATDFFGPIPFPAPGQTAEEIHYIALADQYNEFFSELDEAVKKMDRKLPIIGTDDPVYFGNFDKWQQFANSLRLRLSLKLSEVNTALCAEQAKAALNAPGGLMQPGSDAQLPGTTGWGNAYNYFMYQVSWGEKMSLTTSFEKVLTGIGGIAYNGTANVYPAVVDPRGSRFFDPSVNNKEWKGVFPGLSNENHINVGPNHSFMSEIYILPNDKRKIDCFLYEEVCFLLAEAYHRGFIPGGEAKAKEAYEAGIKSSLDRWGVGGDAGAYLASTAKNKWGTSAAYDDANGAGNTKLEKIITQKYIAGYPDLAYQAWNDKRRLNLPAFDVPQQRNEAVGFSNANTNIKDASNFINRQPFPQSQTSLNKANYEKGVQLLGGRDDIKTNLWWDKDMNYITSVQ